jgi:hypothetical protein
MNKSIENLLRKIGLISVLTLSLVINSIAAPHAGMLNHESTSGGMVKCWSNSLMTLLSHCPEFRDQLLRLGLEDARHHGGRLSEAATPISYGFARIFDLFRTRHDSVAQVGTYKNMMSWVLYGMPYVSQIAVNPRMPLNALIPGLYPLMQVRGEDASYADILSAALIKNPRIVSTWQELHGLEVDPEYDLMLGELFMQGRPLVIGAPLMAQPMIPMFSGLIIPEEPLNLEVCLKESPVFQHQQDAHEYLLPFLDRIDREVPGILSAMGFDLRMQMHLQCTGNPAHANWIPDGQKVLDVTMDPEENTPGQPQDLVRYLSQSFVRHDIHGVVRCGAGGCPSQHATQMARISHFPGYLPVMLKRMSFVHPIAIPELGINIPARQIKITTPLQVPEYLDFASCAAPGATIGNPAVPAIPGIPVVYQLVGGIIHDGPSVHGGHYYTVVRDDQPEPRAQEAGLTFIRYDDEIVEPLTTGQALQRLQQAYVLFFRRVPAPTHGEPVVVVDPAHVPAFIPAPTAPIAMIDELGLVQAATQLSASRGCDVDEPLLTEVRGLFALNGIAIQMQAPVVPSATSVGTSNGHGGPSSGPGLSTGLGLQGVLGSSAPAPSPSAPTSTGLGQSGVNVSGSASLSVATTTPTPVLGVPSAPVPHAPDLSAGLTGHEGGVTARPSGEAPAPRSEALQVKRQRPDEEGEEEEESDGIGTEAEWDDHGSGDGDHDVALIQRAVVLSERPGETRTVEFFLEELRAGRLS